MAEGLYPLVKAINQRHEDAIRHEFRTELETPIFDDLRKKYGAVLKAAWDAATFPARSTSTVLLVERREHPNVEFVLHNFMYFCKGFSLTIVCSDANEAYIRRTLGKHAATTRILPIYKGIGTREQGIAEYNGLFTTRAFWESMDADYILSIQTDCYLRKPLPSKLWTLDYVASPWDWKREEVGGSGLTFRKKECMLDICMIPYEDNDEDAYFSKWCGLKGKKVLPFEEAKDVFSESSLSFDPVGVHQWWTFCIQYYNRGLIKEFATIYEIYTTIHV